MKSVLKASHPFLHLRKKGADVIYGEMGSDDITGGHNVLFGADGGDELYGGSGDDGMCLF